MLKQLALLSMLGGAALLPAQEAPPAAAPQAPAAPQSPAQPQAPAAPEAPAAPQAPAQSPGGFKRRDEAPAAANGTYQVSAGTRILLNMVNSISTKQAQPGDRIYLETAFPVLSGNHIVIPQGSWVTGTITEVKRPGRVKGRGELQVRFDSLILPNGVSRNFRSDLGAVDERNGETLNREQNKVVGPGGKGRDAIAVAGGGVAGAGIGSTIGLAKGTPAKGAGIGAGVGAAAGLVGVLLTRGPDAMLPRGSTVEMVLDRPLDFHDEDLDFSKAPAHAPLTEGEATPRQSRRVGTRFPY
jgi:hypothetical protein